MVFGILMFILGIMVGVIITAIFMSKYIISPRGEDNEDY